MLHIYVVRKPWIGTIRGLPRANRGSTHCATIHGLSVQSVDSDFCATQSQVPQTKGEGHNRREGLRSAVQGDVRDLYLGLVILHCSLWGLE